MARPSKIAAQGGAKPFILLGLEGRTYRERAVQRQAEDLRGGLGIRPPGRITVSTYSTATKLAGGTDNYIASKPTVQ
jgi:hypothetical protein